MYTVTVAREVMSQHFLIGGDWGAENDVHAHSYRVEVTLAGENLDEHGYLVDISMVEDVLEKTLVRYRGAVLNDLPEFAGVNPSVERLARAVWERLDRDLAGGDEMTVRIWENADAAASYGSRRSECA